MNKLLMLSFISISTLSADKFLGFRHTHNGNSHRALSKIEKFITPHINKGRVNVYKVISKKFDLKSQPEFVRDQFFELDLEDLKIRKKRKKIKFAPHPLTNELSPKTYAEYVKSLIKIGDRSTNGVARNYLTSTFDQMGLIPENDNYNVVYKIQGSTKDRIVILGHMDTVRGTVGADDNASGSAGVLELARVLSEEFKNTQPKMSIYFLITEDEEIGLKGASKYVKDLEDKNLLENLKLVINMDMIAYNTNDIIDIETNPEHKELANEFADQIHQQTQRDANLVLQPWGSDHMPFLNKGIPTILSIESWETHTPCWHKSCDTFDTLNIPYAIDILKVNLAMVMRRVE